MTPSSDSQRVIFVAAVIDSFTTLHDGFGLVIDTEAAGIQLLTIVTIAPAVEISKIRVEPGLGRDRDAKTPKSSVRQATELSFSSV